MKDKSSNGASSAPPVPAKPQTSEPLPPASSLPPSAPPPPTQSPEPERLSAGSSCHLPESSAGVGEVRLVTQSPSSSAASSAQTLSVAMTSAAPAVPPPDGLANMDVSDFLSLQSPDTAANIEALLLVAEDFNMTTEGDP